MTSNLATLNLESLFGSNPLTPSECSDIDSTFFIQFSCI